MIQIQDWWKIPQHKRDILIKKFSIKRSGVTSVRGVAAGIDQVIDDGVREGDIEPIKNYELQQLIDLADGKYDTAEVPVTEQIVNENTDVHVEETKENVVVENKKRGRKPKNNNGK